MLIQRLFYIAGIMRTYRMEAPAEVPGTGEWTLMADLTCSGGDVTVSGEVGAGAPITGLRVTRFMHPDDVEHELLPQDDPVPINPEVFAANGTFAFVMPLRAHRVRIYAKAGLEAPTTLMLRGSLYAA